MGQWPEPGRNNDRELGRRTVIVLRGHQREPAVRAGPGGLGEPVLEQTRTLSWEALAERRLCCLL